MGVLTTVKTLLKRNKLGELIVQKGLIDAQDLKDALVAQKEQNKPLGDTLIQMGMITRRDLYSTLFQQWSLRCVAAAATIIITTSSFGVKSAKAGNIKDVPAELTLSATANSAFTKISAYPELYGTSEKRSNNIKPFTKWTGMFKKMDIAMDQAYAEPVIKEWRDDLKSYQNLPLDQMAKRVNQYINKVNYITDQRLWGQSDYWATPIEFFQRGGDCEDFAIAKYMSLRALGVPESRLRIAIVQDLQKNIPHAVLIVYTDKGPMVLDNQVKTAMWAGSAVQRYKPIFSINQNAWWLHKAPTSTVVASIN